MSKKPTPNGKLDAMLFAIKKFALKNGGRLPEAADLIAMGIKEWDIRSHGGVTALIRLAGLQPSPLEKLKQENKILEDKIRSLQALPQIKNALEVDRLKTEIRGYKSQISDLTKEALGSNTLRELIGTLDIDQLGNNSGWLKGSSKSSRTQGIPVLNLSDLHFDEVVHREQVGGMNEYNHEIATRRIKNVAKYAISILKYHMASPKYDGIVLNCLGDMLSGNIHEELAETNEQRINKSILDLTDILCEVVGTLADEFKKVFVPCVTGNHGRMHKKPRAKFRVQDNFEWLIYQYMSRYFKNDDRVSFLIPESSDAYFSIYNYKTISTHGDQFKGGDGVTGCLSAIMRGYAKKQSKQQAMGQPFDFMNVGHFHQLVWYKGIFINSTTKGMDEYSYQNNFTFEAPQQGLYLVHPDWGMVGRWPIFCDEQAPSKSRKPIEVL
jgi:hypothetical protein